MASDEQKVGIANYFLNHSPPGQVNEVLRDVAVLVGKDLLSSEMIEKAVGTYNIDQYAHYDTGAGKMIATPHGQVGSDVLNPADSKLMALENVAKKATATGETQTVPDDVEKYRKALETAMIGYIDSQYTKGKAEAGVYGTADGGIIVCISGFNVNLQNYYSGGWKSTFKFSVKSTGSVTLNGDTRIQVHYFEDGNVQLHSACAKEATVAVEADEEKTAAAVVKVIAKMESVYQNNLEEMYVDLHAGSFKAMRRIWPITKIPMDWTSHTQSLAAELTKK